MKRCTYDRGSGTCQRQEIVEKIDAHNAVVDVLRMKTERLLIHANSMCFSKVTVSVLLLKRLVIFLCVARQVVTRLDVLFDFVGRQRLTW